MNFKHYKESVKHNWSDFWAAPGRRLEFIFSFALLTAVMLMLCIAQIGPEIGRAHV